MLEEARKKNVYESLRRMELGKSLDFPDDVFSATISAGVFTAGHAPPDSFDELVRITEPGGCVIFSVRDDVYREGGFEEKLEALAASGEWTMVEESRPYVQLPLADPNLKARVFVCRTR
jgi:SAM-dependent methyltransferase